MLQGSQLVGKTHHASSHPCMRYLTPWLQTCLSFGSEVVDAWDTYAVRAPPALQLLDYTQDLWEDARLEEVEEWLTQHLQSRSSRRANMWTATA